jgi:DnaJ-class molecular chaperone
MPGYRIKRPTQKCPLCYGTGASNPNAEHSMDWRDYLPCISCHGTGFVVEAKPKERDDGRV